MGTIVGTIGGTVVGTIACAPFPFLRNGRFALFQEQIRDLQAQGAPIDAIGQLHN